MDKGRVAAIIRKRNPQHTEDRVEDKGGQDGEQNRHEAALPPIDTGSW